MATRAVIEIDGMDVCLYKHWDGYPSATLPWLLNFVEKFDRDDKEYMFAQLIRSSAFDAEEFNLDKSRTTGWGVVSRNENCCEEYRYIIKEKSVKVIDVMTGEELQLKELLNPTIND
jgi:hypothetical protein